MTDIERAYCFTFFTTTVFEVLSSLKDCLSFPVFPFLQKWTMID